MRDIDKALMLYQLMADRCEKTMAPKQAEVYREMVEFMKQFDTAAEASIGIKNSKYYLAPSVALVQDKVEALRAASENNGWDQVADVYQKKLDEIEADRDAIYEAGYERTAQNIKIKYVETMEAFGQMYVAYVRICCAAAGDDVEVNDAYKDLTQAAGKLSLPSSDFTDLALLPAFRNLIPAGDEGYAKFVKEARQMLAHGVNMAAQMEAVMDEAGEAWKQAQACKAEILAAARENLPKRKAARVTVVAPADASGDYTYIDEEVADCE